MVLLHSLADPLVAREYVGEAGRVLAEWQQAGGGHRHDFQWASALMIRGVGCRVSRDRLNGIDVRCGAWTFGLPPRGSAPGVWRGGLEWWVDRTETGALSWQDEAAVPAMLARRVAALVAAGIVGIHEADWATQAGLNLAELAASLRTLAWMARADGRPLDVPAAHHISALIEHPVDTYDAVELHLAASP